MCELLEILDDLNWSFFIEVVFLKQFGENGGGGGGYITTLNSTCFYDTPQK